MRSVRLHLSTASAGDGLHGEHIMVLGRLVAVALAFMPAACGVLGRDEAMFAAANALERSSEQCHNEVVKQKMKYQSAPSCTALSALVSEYFSATTMKKVPAEVEVKYYQAESIAWQARLVSESADPESLRIW